MRRVLFKDAAIVTMDERMGDFRQADLLVHGDRIEAIAETLPSGDAEIVDCAGCILIPGLINAHMHTWQTALRSLAANWTLLEYFRWMHAGLATRFLPDDIHIATLVGALNQINCGTTTLVDWCHNNPTPAHSDAAIRALFESGIRAVFFHGSPKPDPKPGERHFSEVPHPRHEVERLLAGPFAARDQLVTLGLAILGPHYSTLDVALHDFELAHEFGLVASMHQGGGPAKTPDGWARLEERGLIGPHVNIVHGNDLSDEQLARFVELGATFTLAPENEMTQGHGFPITGRLRRLGTAPSVGVDLESVSSGDMFTAIRIAMGAQRALDNAESRRTQGKIPDTTTITTREALRWATVEGARMLGMEDRIGTLTPGKQADLVVLDATALNMWPAHDLVSTVVMQTSLANVESVMIAGEFKKRDGRLLAPELDARKTALSASGRRIAQELGLLGQAA